MGATLQELEAGCIGADANFLVTQMKADADLPTAQKAWMLAQAAQIAEAKKATTEAAEELKAAKQAFGTKPLPAGEVKDGEEQVTADPNKAFQALVNANVASGLPKAKAVRQAVIDNPEVHKQMLEANAITIVRKGR